ncbi:MAG: 3-dehydroquinate synthase [Parcubacteria group bacterium GW2011_GWA2_49_9]|nr:MAG: 3-dehydroquinate synthase [Parcubacteria group bacterium GW2011_GWA2_49_9]
MQTINVQLKKVIDTSYGITVGAGLLARLPEMLKRECPASSYVIIADKATEKLFGRTLEAELKKAGSKVLLLSVPNGELSKSQKEKSRLEEAMLKAGVDRKAVVLALGGGVVGDLAGFVSATYMRGIPYIQLPTTLLAMVDSSVGGKTGINNKRGKNLIGAFHQPSAVYADVETLKSLSDVEIRNGLVEAVKMFMTSDKESFEFAKEHLDEALTRNADILAEIIARAVRIKAGVVERDEYENGERMVLNFGHTIGHAIEKLSGFKMLHGQAVAVGIMVEAQIAHTLGRLSAQALSEVREILARLETPLSVLKKMKPATIIAMTKGDKKSVAGQARYVILKEIGKVEEKDGRFVEEVGDEEVMRAINNTNVRTKDTKVRTRKSLHG